MSENQVVKQYKTSEAKRKAIKKWQDANREHVNEVKREWIRANKDKNNANVRRFRSRQKELRDGFRELSSIDCF